MLKNKIKVRVILQNNYQKLQNNMSCEHKCSGNCRRIGCHCSCGEWHVSKENKLNLPTTKWSEENSSIIISKKNFETYTIRIGELNNFKGYTTDNAIYGLDKNDLELLYNLIGNILRTK